MKSKGQEKKRGRREKKASWSRILIMIQNGKLTHKKSVNVKSQLNIDYIQKDSPKITWLHQNEGKI